jgi:hypothetical protein
MKLTARIAAMIASLLATCPQIHAAIDIGNPLIAASYPGYRSDDLQYLFVLDFGVSQAGTLQSVVAYSQGATEGSANGSASAGHQFYLYVLRPDAANSPGSYYDVVYQSEGVTVGSPGINQYPISPFTLQAGDVIAHWGNGIPFNYLDTTPDSHNSTMWVPADQPQVGKTWSQYGNFANYKRQYSIQVEMTPVPEPSTYLAGALLLLPFAFQAIRSRRQREQPLRSKPARP